MHKKKNSNHKKVLYESLKSACEEYYEYCGSENFSPDGLRTYEDEVIERAMKYVYDNRVWTAIWEMIGSKY